MAALSPNVPAIIPALYHRVWARTRSPAVNDWDFRGNHANVSDPA
jgi:hypothetical protein